MDRLNHLKIETSLATSELCLSGARENTDKSPYSAGHHRHPYTAVYDLLFSPRRFESLVFGEIGVAQNASMRMWRDYFPNAEIFGFEYDETLIERARSERLSRVHYQFADVTSRVSLMSALFSAQKLFDILIDDSTHKFADQVAFVPVAIKYVKPGGIIIVEDIFRQWDEQLYADALRPYFDFFASGLFVDTDHVYKKSDGEQEPYYDNDKLLVLIRNDRDGRDIELSSP